MVDFFDAYDIGPRDDTIYSSIQVSADPSKLMLNIVGKHPLTVSHTSDDSSITFKLSKKSMGESIDKTGDLLLERWHKIIGIN
jgi:hypothetical protein